MAPAKETISCVLDRPRQLRLSWAELCWLDRKLHEDPRQLRAMLLGTQADIKEFSVKSLWALQALLWAALHWEDESLTLEQVPELIAAFINAGRGNEADLGVMVLAAFEIGGYAAKTDVEKNVWAEAVTMLESLASANGATTPAIPHTSSDSSPANGST